MSCVAGEGRGGHGMGCGSIDNLSPAYGFWLGLAWLWLRFVNLKPNTASSNQNDLFIINISFSTDIFSQRNFLY